MLSTRNVLLITISVAMISVAGVLVNMAQPPDSGGTGRDSFGTQIHGYRALFETFQELKLPVSRGLIPPNSSQNKDSCVVFWGPDPELVSMEPDYLKQVGERVRQGATVVVAAKHAETRFGAKMPIRPVTQETTIFQALGVGDIAFKPLNTSSSGTTGSIEQVQTFKVKCDGVLKTNGKGVSTIAAQGAAFQEIDLSGPQGPEPVGSVHASGNDGADHVVAALYKVGGGEVLVFSDETLMANGVFAQNDNAVLAASLLYRSGRPLVIDEFYHGLTIRGNPAWLLTRPPYGLLISVLVAATALWSWREGTRLGPNLPDSVISRRNIGEYVDAMARLFQRSGCNQYALTELKDGILWMLSRQHHLSPRKYTAEEIAAVITRTDPAAAERLRKAAASIDALIEGNSSISSYQALKTARQISKCL